MTKVAVSVDSPLYLPEWVMRMKAEDRLKKLMAMSPGADLSVTPMSRVEKMGPNDKVQGSVVVQKPNKKDYLIVPSLGVLSADEVKWLVGRVIEGGYGKGPEHHSEHIDWKEQLGNLADQIIEQRKDAGKLKFAV